jgi:hypothetical protein
MEKAYRDYGHDIDNTDNIISVGLSFTVDTGEKNKQNEVFVCCCFYFNHCFLDFNREESTVYWQRRIFERLTKCAKPSFVFYGFVSEKKRLDGKMPRQRLLQVLCKVYSVF